MKSARSNQSAVSKASRPLGQKRTRSRVATSESHGGLPQPQSTGPANGKRGFNVDMLTAISYICIGLVITLMLLALKVGIEHTAVGASAEKRAYELLTSVLPNFRPDGVKVTLLDIGHIRLGAEDPSTGKLIPTARDELLKLIEALVALRPRAIGVDIDFSPTPNGWVDDNDPQFLQRCLELSETTPIVLGVFRTLREPRTAWLGLPEYASLAGNMWLPISELERTPVWTQAPGVQDRLPSFGAALAKAESARSTRLTTQEIDGGWRQRFRERVTRRIDGLTVEEVLTDHSASRQVAREAIRITSVDQLQRYRGSIEGRVVILGVVDKATDRFPVPGQQREIPGVVVHAAVVNTLVNEPIWELSGGARLALDILLSLALLVASLVLVRRSRARLHAGHVAIEASEKRVLRWLVLVTFVGGVAAVVLLRVLWLDFFLVALTLVLHPMIGHRLQHTWVGQALSRQLSSRAM